MLIGSLHLQGTPYFQLKKHGTLSGVFVRPSQVHIIDARPQDEYDDEALQEDNEDVDISQDEIQGEAIPEDDEVFAIPAPPKVSISHQTPQVRRDVLSFPAHSCTDYD